MSETSKLRVSIWALYDSDAPLMMVLTGDEHLRAMKELPRHGSGLHREVYSWQTSEDVLGGVMVAERRQLLSEAFFVALRPDKPPAERGIAALREFIVLARQTLNEGATEWCASASSSDDDGSRRINPLLALVAHLEWLASVHEGKPGISVTVR